MRQFRQLIRYVNISQMITHTDLILLLSLHLFFTLLFDMNQSHLLQNSLQFGIINYAANIFKVKKIRFSLFVLIIGDLVDPYFLVEKLEFVYFNNKRIPVTFWDVDYFENPVKNAYFFQWLLQNHWLAIFNKEVKHIPGKIIQWLVRMRLILFFYII